ncbi:MULTISPECIES: GNAT family N-acetyltransferase [unclassified Frankia]|uniref:GNAT family N-acetyltransferase n=1 Tax=unclassified Frankia TaxID=2632575 RepID=UPI002023EFB0
MGLAFHVRRIAPGDAERLRGVRLAALADAPGSFWQTLAAESARPGADWQARASRNAMGDAHATFLLESDHDATGDGSSNAATGGAPVAGGAPVGGGVVMGMVDVYRPSLAPEFRELAAMWVAPAIRGTGAAGALLDAAVDWARTVGAIGVRLWVVPTNTAAVRLYARHGFEPAGDPEPDTDDGGGGKSYLPMLRTLDERAAASPTFVTRALAPWTDEST